MNIPSFSGRDAASLPKPSSSNTQAPAVAISRGQSVVIALWMMVLLAIMVAAGLLISGGAKLVVVFVAMAVFTIVLGRSIVHRAFGILINERNLMSLSRFQLIVWTVIILSSYLCYGLARVRHGIENPLDITIDNQLLLLMGISATSFIAAPVILGIKKDKEPEASVTAKTAQKSGESTEEVEDNRQGIVYANSSTADARFTDIFQGDELANTMHIDVAKLQLFFFTIVGAVAYFASVFRELSTHSPEALTSLPLLPTGMIMAVGISHVGYLGGKGINHTPTQN